MKVFISWSGEESHAVAQVLRTQLPCFIQLIKPFVSSEDISKGAAWFQEIGTELEQSGFGIICLTAENQNSKWVLFEAGALAGRFSKTKVAPLLIGTSPTAIKPPLSQFQLTELDNKEDFYKLLASINICLGSNAVSQETLRETFNNCWGGLNDKIKTALAKVQKKETKPAERSEKEILEEVLGIVRSLRSTETGPSFGKAAKRTKRSFLQDYMETMTTSPDEIHFWDPEESSEEINSSKGGLAVRPTAE